MRWSFVILAVSIAGWYFLTPFLAIVVEVSNGYGAKLACSVVFVSNRPLESALNAEFVFPPIKYITSFEVDAVKKCVYATSWLGRGTGKRAACYKSTRVGCSLLSPSNPLPPYSGKAKPPPPDPAVEWPVGGMVAKATLTASQIDAFEGVGYEAIDRVVSAHFEDERLHARAVVIVRKGKIIYEKYGDGCNETTPLLGWSMTKSVINALVGSLVLKGVVSLDTNISFDNKQWEDTHLTLRDALRMEDGLDFDEYYEPGYQVTDMLFRSPELWNLDETPKFRLKRGKCFRYSSQTSNLISRFLRHLFEKREGGYTAYLDAAADLFDEIGMSSAVLETDPDGTFVASSFSYASARDWARFGLLYLNDGMWQKKIDSQPERILAENWVNFSSTPVLSSNNVYGAHFWLGGRPVVVQSTQEEQIQECDKIYPTRLNPPRDWLREAFPHGTFIAHGFEEQLVAVLPSRDAVLVRLGATKEKVLQWDKNKFYSEIIQALPEVK